MTLPSFDQDWINGKRCKPRICVLEIRNREKPESEPIAWLFIERQETYQKDERDGSIFKASIRLTYECITAKHAYNRGDRGSFVGGYSRGYSDMPSVSLTSESLTSGAVFLDLPGLEGQRIGTYLMNELVLWVQQWPEASVSTIALLAGQADDENKARRNHFYEQFGLVFDYSTPEQREGSSLPILAGALTPVETWKQNLRERTVHEYIGEILYERDRLALEMTWRTDANTNMAKEITLAKTHPVRWALHQLWWQIAPPLTWIIIMIILGTVMWASFRSK